MPASRSAASWSIDARALIGTARSLAWMTGPRRGPPTPLPVQAAGAKRPAGSAWAAPRRLELLVGYLIKGRRSAAEGRRIGKYERSRGPVAGANANRPQPLYAAFFGSRRSLEERIVRTSPTLATKQIRGERGGWTRSF